MKAVVYTLGCKVNKNESDAIMYGLKSRGYELSDKLEYADIYIINTCAVTSDAEKKSRQFIAKASKLNPSAKIVVCGCSVQNDRIPYLKNPKVSLLAGTAKKLELIDKLELNGSFIDKIEDRYEEAKTYKLHTRAFIKVQDGCDNFCSYCVVPYLRGKSRSRSLESILEEINSQGDVKEVILTAINLSKYGLDFKDGTTVVTLIEALQNFDLRLRLTSLEINVITPQFLDALRKCKGFCDHFHLSIQSCSDEVLQKMNRKYTARQIFEAIKLIRNYFPSAAIGADIIAGFPTETEAQHNETLKNIQKLNLSDIHIFPYSKRKGTAAAALEQLEPPIIAGRCFELKQIREAAKGDFLNRQIGKTVSLLTEKGGKDFGCGLTKNYVRAYFKRAKNIKANEILNLLITARFRDGVKGELIND
jgi:threonylcarbamoyladenosine tRNA methylthiotransferase MtaB